jgi:hypothetical protein
MPVETFLVPRDHTLEEILNFGTKINTYIGASREFVFDFQGKGLDTPFGMLFLSSAIKEFIHKHSDVECKPVNFEEHGYASHMGYFQACGFEIGNLPGEARGNDTYLPITVIPITELKEQAKNEIRHVGDVIEDHSRKLSTILLRRETGPLADILTYTFREMLRNILEHSQSKTLAFCAQYRKKANQAEIAILDTGIGIRAALSNNPYLKIDGDHDALNLALMPGISGKMFKGIKRDPYDGWQNSGYGLFAVSRLCGHGGKFTICSGDTALALKPDKKEYHQSMHQGTALRIILSAAEIKNAKSTLARIMEEGDKQAHELGIAEAQASAASKMLSSEFTEKKE